MIVRWQSDIVTQKKAYFPFVINLITQTIEKYRRGGVYIEVLRNYALMGHLNVSGQHNNMDICYLNYNPYQSCHAAIAWLSSFGFGQIAGSH